MTTKKIETKGKIIEKGDGRPRTGLPTLAFLPARNYKYKMYRKEYKISIPRSGTFEKLDPNFFKEEDGEFDILDLENSMLHLPVISKVLLGARKYPDLELHQLFVPTKMVFKKKTIEIMGHVVDMLRS
jgi:hypothetical protein